MQVLHLGHACLLIEAGQTRVLVDPGTLSRGARSVSNVSAVVVTHDHRDHRDDHLIGEILDGNREALLLDKTSLFPSEPSVGERTSVDIGDITIQVRALRHAPVYGDEPDMVNLSLTVPGALHFPGDSFDMPEQPVYALALPIGGPWLKLAEAVDYARAVGPDIVLPVHEGQLADPAHTIGILRSLLPTGMEVVTSHSDQPVRWSNSERKHFR